MDLSSLLQEQLSKQLSGGLMDVLSEQIGGADPKTTTTASSAILSSLMGALARNASTPDGASALAKALDRDHDGSILDDLGSLLGGLGGAKQQEAPQIPDQFRKTLDGGGILDHILGEQKEETMEEVSKTSGLSLEKVGPLMVTLAPILMGMLGKAKKTQGLDAGGLGGALTDLLTNSKEQNKAPDLGLAGQLLDRNKDGSIIDDIASIGMKMLGGFFRK
jgi:hypothetical protein